MNPQRALLSGTLALALAVLPGCGQQTERGTTPEEATEHGVWYRGGSIVSDAGMFGLLPEYIKDAEGPVEIDGLDASAALNSTLFLMDADGTEQTVRLASSSSNQELLGLLGLWNADDATVAVVSACTKPLTTVENQKCATDAQQLTRLFLVQDRSATLLPDSSSAALEGLMAVSPTRVGSPTAFGLTRRGSSVQVSSIDWRTGRVAATSDVDARVSENQTVCVTATGAVVGAGSGDDTIDLAVQDPGGRVSTATIPWDAGWFGELRCGSDSASIVTAFGAVYRVGSDANDVSMVVDQPPSQGSRVFGAAIPGPTADEWWVVASEESASTGTTVPGGSAPSTSDGGPSSLGGDETTERFITPGDSAEWASASDGMTEARAPWIRASADGSSLLGWGQQDGSRNFYSVGQSDAG